MIHLIEKMMPEDVWMIAQILTTTLMEMNLETSKMTPAQTIMIILVGVTITIQQNLSLEKCAVHAEVFLFIYKLFFHVN